MTKKRTTPELEFERLAERLYRDYGHEISDKETFDLSFNQYLKDVEDDNRIFLFKNRNLLFEIYRKKYKIYKESVFKKAKGKDFKKDIKTTAKTIVKTQREYRKRGASKVDLRDYDVKRKLKPIPKIRPLKKRQFNYVGKQKGKVKYATKIFIVVRKKKTARYVDKGGKYVSIRRKRYKKG